MKELAQLRYVYDGTSTCEKAGWLVTTYGLEDAALDKVRFMCLQGRDILFGGVL